ncbi:MAG: hypothetical protein CVU44_18605 [Chloroflexi bacterium HGW-Chloroflexi-6]|nr:MAG: hypothetical protein CVU44_18605 [Chloroflexi bacterium HGW-Chloroflexi-6]
MRLQRLLLVIFFVVLGGILYLPFATQFGYYNDDWYSMYAARVAGPDIFHEVYAIDRPGRAYVMEPLYILFQGIPLYYNLLAVALRVGGALVLLWLLKLLWPRQQTQNSVVALLFLAYPGFLNMPNAIDFQSHLIGILLAFLSLALMLKAFGAAGIKKWLFYAASLLTGLAYLSQMEYYIGFEFVRVCIIALIVLRATKGILLPRILRVVQLWMPYALVPGLYLLWRIFLFDNQRKTTDLATQLGQLLSEPALTLYNWFFGFVQSFLNVLLLAWAVPLSDIGFSLPISDVLKAILIGLFAAGLGIAGLWYFFKKGKVVEDAPSDWQREAFWLGLAWLIVGLIAVVMANRAITFPEYSRYGMVSAAGAILLLVVLLFQIPQQRFQVGFLSFLLFSAGMTHYANGAIHAVYWSDLRSFWWQVSWRIPQLEQGATIVGYYPRGGIKESSSVWGPANQIYYPTRIDPEKVQAGVHAALLNHDTVLRAFNGERQVYRKEIIVETYRNYRRLLLAIQPATQSCVQVIDGSAPEYSANAPDTALLLGSYSKIDDILVDEPAQTPPDFLFGSEPAHDWCYYYQKASLARQRGEWDEIIDLYEQSRAGGFSARDPIEWMPFLQAFAHTGNSEYLEELSPSIMNVPYVSQQVCHSLKNLSSLASDVTEIIDETYCLQP